MSRGFPEKINSMSKEEINASIERTRESKRKYNKKYWERHKKEISDKRKEDYAENKDKISLRNKQWLRDNRDKWNAYQRAYRAKLKLDRQKKV